MKKRRFTRPSTGVVAGGRCATVFVLVLSVASTGCSGATSDADSGADAGATDELVTPPDIPWLEDGVPPIAAPALTPCPSGWREVTVDGIAECDPYPEGGPHQCGPGEAHFVGEPGCRPVGGACPSGDFADVTAAIYVLDGAMPGGDGTRASPFDSLSRVPWASLAPGTVVALGKGTYGGTLPLRAGVQVVGACAAETILTGVNLGVPGVITVTSAGDPAHVRNITVRGAPQRAVAMSSGHLVVDGVVMEACRQAGVALSGTAHVELSDVAIRDTEPQLGEGFGIVALEGTRLEAHRLVIEGATKGALIAVQASAIALFDTAIVDTQPWEGRDGRAIYVQGGTTFSLERVLLARSLDVALTLQSGVVGTASDLVVQDVRAPTGSTRGIGVSIENGSTMAAERVLVSDADTSGVALLGAGANLDLADAVIRDMAPMPAQGRGLLVEEDASITANRIAVTRANDVGILVITRATARIGDVSVTETQAGGAGSLGVPVAVSAGSLELTRARLVGGFMVSLQVQDADADVSVTDAVFRGSQARADGNGGRATNVVRGASLRLSRVLVEDMLDVGLFVGEPDTSMSATDVVVRRIAGRNDGYRGRGIQGQMGAALDLERVSVEEIQEFGVVLTTGTSGTVRDLSIRGVVRSGCPAGDCGAVDFGHGLVTHGSTASVTRFRVADVATCGVYVSEAGDMPVSTDLQTGRVERCAIGACVSAAGFEIGRLTQDVDYADNMTNLQADALPLPDLNIVSGF